MSYRKIWFTFFTSLFSLITFFLAAQQSDLSFNHLTVENGLPIGHVLSIFEDSRGFVWFGTDDGLCRFDGIHCKMYKHDEKDSSSIRGTRIGNMVEDKNGNLWITSDDALNCYVRAHDSFRSFRINAGTESNNFIYAVFALKNDSVVIIQNATHQLYDFNISSKTFSRTDSLGYFRLLLNQSVLRGNHIAVLSNETGNGISIWHFDHDVPVREDFFTLETHSKLTDLPLGQIVVESDSLVWLNCEKGLVAFNPSTKNYRIYNPLQNDFPVFTLLFERGNELLIGSNEGLWIFNKFQRKFTTHFQHEDSNSESLSGNIISDAGLLDHNNNLWIEVFAKGIDYVNLNKKKFNHYLDEKEAKEKGIDNFVRCMAEDSEGDVWCGTMQNKLYVFDKQKNLIEDYSKDITGANSASVVYLFRDKQNRMWVINNQLFVFDPGRKTFQSVSGVHTAVNIAQLHDGTIVFTEWRQGIFKLKEAGGNFSVEPTAIKGLFSERQAMYEDHQKLSLRVRS